MADPWLPVSTAVLESAFRGVVAVHREPAGTGLRPVRLHPDLMTRSPESLALMARFTSGVRLRFVTAADRVRIEAVFTRYVMAHLEQPASRAELLAEVDGIVVDAVAAEPTALVFERRGAALDHGPEIVSTVELELGPAHGEREVVIWFPADAAVLVRSVLATGEVRAAPAAAGVRWVHHGSSISHGGDAADARGTWPAQAGRALGVEWTNLGFGGNALIDPPTARAIGRIPVDILTLKFGINIVTGDAMRGRVFVPALHGFLDTVRDAHPDVPIVLMSALSCPAFEELPGPRRLDAEGRLTGTVRTGEDRRDALSLSDTRARVEEVFTARADDLALFLMDGRELLGPDDTAHLYDGVHPDPAGYNLVASRFVAAASDPRRPLGRAFALARSRAAG